MASPSRTCSFLDTIKHLIDEIEALKAQKEPSNGLKTFVEKSPLVKEVKALRKQNLKQEKENQKQQKEYEKLADKYEDLSCEHNELIRDSKCVDLTFEAHKIEYDENIKELEEANELNKEVIEVLNHNVFTYQKEIRRLKEALNKVRRDLSPDR